MNAVALQSDTIKSDIFYANENKVEYYDGFFFGLNQMKNTFYDYQMD